MPCEGADASMRCVWVEFAYATNIARGGGGVAQRCSRANVSSKGNVGRICLHDRRRARFGKWQDAMRQGNNFTAPAAQHVRGLPPSRCATAARQVKRHYATPKRKEDHLEALEKSTIAPPSHGSAVRRCPPRPFKGRFYRAYAHISPLERLHMEPHG